MFFLHLGAVGCASVLYFLFIFLMALILCLSLHFELELCDLVSTRSQVLWTVLLALAVIDVEPF